MLPALMNWIQNGLGFGGGAPNPQANPQANPNQPQQQPVNPQQSPAPNLQASLQGQSQQQAGPSWQNLMGRAMANYHPSAQDEERWDTALNRSIKVSMEDYKKHNEETREREKEAKRYQDKLDREEKTDKRKKYEFENLSAYQKGTLANQSNRVHAMNLKSSKRSKREDTDEERKVKRAQKIWTSMPIEQRNEALAISSGMGWPLDYSARVLSTGEETLESLAEKKGVKLEEVEKSYAPTRANITQMKSMEASGAELQVLEDYVTDAVKNYPTTWWGFSPSQVVDAIFDLNEDDQAKFLAARALQPEIAGARNRISGSSNAFAAIHEIQEKALGSSEIFRSMVSQNVYEKTQHYIGKWLQEGLKERKRVLYNTKKITKKEERNEERNEGRQQQGIKESKQPQGRHREFLMKAKEQNPDASEEDLNKFYEKHGFYPTE